MQTEFEISGMHCNGCVSRVSKALQAIEEVEVTLEPPRARFVAPVELAAVQAALSKAGEYRAKAA